MVQDTPSLNDLARSYIDSLVASLKREGRLTSPLLEEAFKVVPRHAFIDAYYTPNVPGIGMEQWHRVQLTSDMDPAIWLEAIYANLPLITSVDEFGNPTSSSSSPEVMASMLEALHLHAGLRVLEVGTGTGYNAALLAHIVGDPRLVFSIELDAMLAQQAQQKLNQVVGIGVTVQTGNGLEGYSQGAPYDRIIATGSYHKIPLPWLDQLQVGGKLVMVLRNMGLLQLEKVGSRRTARGRLLAPVFFMELRQPGQAPTPLVSSLFSQYARRPVGTKLSLARTEFDPTLLLDAHLACLLQCEFPHASVMWIPEQADIPLTLQWVDPASETLVRFRSNEQPGVWEIRVSGEVETWERLYRAYRLWEDLGRPATSNYVVNADETGRQSVTISSPKAGVSSPTWILAE
jgi:protein-L-isoaspartate(D-aspartate) O-methyltransferase